MPYVEAQKELKEERAAVIIWEVPLESLRTTRIIDSAGRMTPGFSSAKVVSFHQVMFPAKISAIAERERTRVKLEGRPGRLYTRATDLTTGTGGKGVLVSCLKKNGKHLLPRNDGKHL